MPPSYDASNELNSMNLDVNMHVASCSALVRAHSWIYIHFKIVMFDYVAINSSFVSDWSNQTTTCIWCLMIAVY